MKNENKKRIHHNLNDIINTLNVYKIRIVQYKRHILF